MIKAAILGLGWWGSTLVEAVAESPLIRVVAACRRSPSAKDREFASRHGLRLTTEFQDLLNDPSLDAIILATPPRGHLEQILAAAAAGKHVFCEKPFTFTNGEARAAIAAANGAKVTLGLGYNRRFHPCWIDLKNRIAAGELGTILHLECTMTGPNGLNPAPNAWRSNEDDAPCGGLFPMGVHGIDGFVDLVGPARDVFAQSFRRAVATDNDDTTSALFRMEAGMSAYLATMTATTGSFRFTVYGSRAMAQLGGMTHVAGQSSQQRRVGLFGQYIIQTVAGEKLDIEVPEFDVNRAELEAFALAASGKEPFPISPADMIATVSATEATIQSARSGLLTPVTAP